MGLEEEERTGTAVVIDDVPVEAGAKEKAEALVSR